MLFRTERQNGSDYFLFLNEAEDEYPLAVAGSYIIRRRSSDGEFTQVKVFLQNNDGSFVRIVPDGLRSRMDIFLSGVRVYRNVPLPFDIRDVLGMPFSGIVGATSAMIDWSIFVVETGDPGYARLDRMAQRLRELLPALGDADDGAMDASGRLVFIETLQEQPAESGFNCSGFAKWVVDGLYEPRYGTLLSVEALKQKHLDVRGTRWSAALEDERDPYFGLDWSRNLAAALNPGSEIEDNDVRDVPFTPYIEDVGYPVEDLPAVLYWLARTEPGYLYLGSVNRMFGESPVLRQHTHVVVLLPYFGPHGEFRPVVMERNVETNLASLQRRYEDGFVHLVRIPTIGSFVPPPLF